MKSDLDNRLQQLIGEHKINLMSPKGLLEISIATIEIVKTHQIQSGRWTSVNVQAFDQVSGELRSCR